MSFPLVQVLTVFLLSIKVINSFTLVPSKALGNSLYSNRIKNTNTFLSEDASVPDSGDSEWAGEVVSNTGKGKIKGCSVTQVDGSLTMWTIFIDGVEADLGKFSEAIYKKIIMDAKQQRFQGFRPGTIPPHLQPTYYIFSMDEAAREATLEAMEQNDMRPFETCRNDLLIENVSIPPPKLKKKKKKKKKGGRKKAKTAAAEAPVVEDAPPEVETEVWMTYPTIKEAVNAGWKPGQSFSFIAKNVQGQKVLGKATISPQVSPVGAGGAAFDLNKVAADVAGGGWKDE